MQMLSDPLSYTDENFSARQVQAVNMARAKIESFRKTGEIPEEILRAINKEAEEFGLVEGTRGFGKYAGLDLADLSPEARGLAISRRRQIQDVFAALQMNTDARKIPEIVRRITDHYTATALQEKGGRVTAIIPEAVRGRLRTFGSEGASAPGLSDMGIRGGRISKGVEQIDVLTGVGTPAQKTARATFVQFSMTGNAITITDDNAALYKAALGTFDLDDKGLLNMNTFKDAQGKTRIAFTTLRDPKSLEESVLMRANLAHAETLQKLLLKDENVSELLKLSLSENGLLQGMLDEGIGEQVAKKAYRRLQETLHLVGDIPTAEKDRLNAAMAGRAIFNSEEDLFAVETVMRLVSEKTYGKLPSLNVGVNDIKLREFESLALQETAATRGRAALKLDPVTGQYRTAQLIENLGAEQGNKYFRRSFVELAREEPTAGKGVIDDYVKLVEPRLKELGIIKQAQSITAKDLQTILNQADKKTQEVIRGIYNFGLESLLQKTTSASLPEAAETVGALTNRMTSVFSVADQMDELLKGVDLTKVGIQGVANVNNFINAIEDTYSIGFTPASDLVDLVKQLVGINRIKSFQEVTSGMDAANKAKMRNVYASILRAQGKEVTDQAINNLSEYRLMDVTEAAAEQQFRRLGLQRALATATGAAEAPGFDPLVLLERFKGKEDIQNLKAQVVSGYEDFLAQADAGRLKITQDQRSAVQSQLDAIKALGEDEKIIEALSMKQGSDLYNRYASVSTQRKLARDALSATELQKRQMIKEAAEANTSARFDMRGQAKALIESMERPQVTGERVKLKSLFQQLTDLEELRIEKVRKRNRHRNDVRRTSY
jgi:hypothetical protein